jgi:hypothetical protein
MSIDKTRTGHRHGSPLFSRAMKAALIAEQGHFGNG